MGIFIIKGLVTPVRAILVTWLCSNTVNVDIRLQIRYFWRVQGWFEMVEGLNTAKGGFGSSQVP